MEKDKPTYEELERQFLAVRYELEELKKKESSGNESTIRFQLLYENSFDAILLTSPDGNIYSANPAACKMFQMTEEEICTGGRQVITDKSDPRLAIAVESREKNGYFNGELTFIRKNGKKFQGECTTKLFIDNTGEKRTSMIIRDISERKAIEQTLRESEEKLRTVFEVLPIGISLINDNRTIIQMNSALEKIIKLSLQELHEGKHKLRKYVRSDGSIMPVSELASERAVHENRIIQDVETGILLEDGSVIWTSVSAAPLKINNLSVVVVTADINSRKQAEIKSKNDEIILENYLKELKTAKDKAEENEKQFQLLFENMEQGFALHEMIYDNNNPVDYRFVMTNKAFKQLTRNFNQDLVGKTVKEILPNTEQIWIDNYGKVAQTGISLSFESYSVEFDKYYNVIAYSPKKDFFAVVFTDVSKNKNYEKELIKAKEKAEESDRLKSAFLANMSHEIRTPMNAIIGFSEFLTNPGIDDEKKEIFTRIIQRRSYDLLRMIEDILDVSKIEVGQLKVFFTPVKLSKLLNDLYEFYQIHINTIEGISKISISLSLPDELKDKVINTDEVRIKQVLVNLIDNAIKFTKGGFVEFGVMSKSNSEVIFYVKDTGIGIEPKKHAVIFDRFRQAEETHGSRQYGGTGLGLSIVKGILDLFHCNIWLESEIGKGATFYFNYPLLETKLENEPQTMRSIGTQNWTNKTILIVEDDAMNSLYLKELFEATGAKLLTAYSGHEALEVFNDNPQINLVLMDIRLPDNNGLKVTRLIKKKEPKVIVIAQTAYATTLDIKECLDAGCNDYISKPINPQKLTDLINKYFSVKRIL